MTVAELLPALAAIGVCLVVSGDGRQLGVEPAGRLTRELRQAVIDQKPALLKLFRCERCGSTDYRDIVIHSGRSTRRDCARCGRFMGWPRWYCRGITDEYGLAKAKD